MAALLKSRWLVPVSIQRGSVRLFCLPYAGSQASVFSSWRTGLPPEIEVYAIQLPGRGPRTGECLYTNLLHLVDDIAAVIDEYISIPFAFFGHSMGAHIVFELTRKLRRLGRPQPMHIFVSGATAPHWPRLEPILFNVPDAELVAHLKQMNGTPSKVLENRDMLQIVLPILRADFEMFDTYNYRQEPPLEVAVSAYGGASDGRVPLESLRAWAEHTGGPFFLKMFTGGHFYLISERPRLLETLAAQLTWTAKTELRSKHRDLRN